MKKLAEARGWCPKDKEDFLWMHCFEYKEIDAIETIKRSVFKQDKIDGLKIVPVIVKEIKRRKGG